MEQTGDIKYGGCEGPDAMYVKLISYDGHEFIIKREYALTSGTIKAMLSGPGQLDLFVAKQGVLKFRFIIYFKGQFAENETNEILFREIP